MAHKSLIGGTAYDITSGTSMVSGTTYNISGGRTLVDGTGYNISFTQPSTAMLYSDGSFVFQADDSVESGKTLTASYTDFEDISTPPWRGKQNKFTSVNFNTEIAPTSIAYWFNNARYMVANISNFSNLNMNNVTTMYCTYNYCANLTGSPVCGNNVTTMYCTYFYCANLTGSPVCGNKVTTMRDTYYGCANLTGSPVCGNNVTSMYRTYFGCYNLTGSPVCGNKVIDMSLTYCDCRNLTGSPVCSNNVTNMSYTYYGCRNLTGSPVCGNNVTDMSYTYYGCYNLNAGTFYFRAKNIANFRNCFYGKNNSRRYNIHVPTGSNTLNRIYNTTNTYSIVGQTITWTNDGKNFYNTKYNIYIYANSSL